MIYKDIIGNYTTEFPKLDEMRKLFHVSFYDGALSGLCLINNDKCWFQCIEDYYDNNTWDDDNDDYPPWYRRFIIFKLSDDKLKRIEENHEKFRTMVGTHTDYDENGKRDFYQYSATTTKETADQYFKEYASASNSERENLLQDKSQIVGWYEW